MVLLKLPSAAMRPKAPKTMGVRLPSAFKRAPVSKGDLPISPPHSDYEDQDEQKSQVRRLRFSLKHNSSSQEFTESYELEPTPLGKGGFGVVYRAKLRGSNGVVRAVKAVNKNNMMSENLVRHEAAILRRLDHPHVCRLFETFDARHCVYLVMEYVDGQELFDYIQDSILNDEHLDENLASLIMRQIFGALHYCHERSVVHRDLKPENVMVQRLPKGTPKNEVQVKLIDFGLAIMCNHVTKKISDSSMIGTFDYLAPEARKGYSMMGPPADVWSAGMVLHALLLGNLPDEDVRMGALPLDRHSEPYEGVSEMGRSLLQAIIQPDPHRRLTAAQAAGHPWTQRVTSGGATQTKPTQGTMEAFLAFHRSTLLQRAVLTALAMQMAGPQLTELREQFLHIDQDGNGRLSREELFTSLGLNTPGLSTDAKDWFESIFDSVDTDGSQEIEYTEWLAATSVAAVTRAEEAMKAAFRVFDVDGSGKISQQEFGRVVKQTPAELARFMPQFDLDGDGEVDFEEFKKMINQIPSVTQTVPVSTPTASINDWWAAARAFFGT